MLIGKHPTKIEPKTGALCFREECYSIRSFRLSSWQEGLHLFTWCGGWTLTYEDPRIVLIATDKRNLVNYDLTLFTDSIPEKIQDLVCRYQYGQLTLLRILRYYPEALELAVNAPIIFWLLAASHFNSDIFKQDSWRKRLCSRHSEILEFLGYKVSKSMLKLIKKIHLEEYTKQELFLIQKVLSSKVLVRLLRHFPMISRIHLEYAVKYPALMRCNFIWKKLIENELGGISDIDLCHSLYEDTLKAGKMLGIKNLYGRIQSKRSLITLERMHDSWTRRLFLYQDREQQKQIERTLKIMEAEFGQEFPLPPLPGNKDIEPILTLKELIKEGKYMKHCVVTHAKDIYRRKRYVYRMYKPQRASLELDLTTSPPSLKEIRLKNNQVPSSESHRHAKDWLAIVLGLGIQARGNSK